MMKYQNATNKMTQFVTVKSLIWPWGQRSPTMVRDTSSGGGLPTCQIWKAYLERQKSYSPDTICYGCRDRFDLEVKIQGQRSPTMVCDTLSGGGLPTCQIWKAYLEWQKSYSPDAICYGHMDQFVEVKGHQQWYVTHRLEVVYRHAKYEKPVLNDKKVRARTRFVTDAGTNLTLSKFKVKGHQQWYAAHRLEVVYLHAKYEKPVLKSLIWPWGQNSRSKVTNNGTRHIVWRWSTYMPNMKSLSWTTTKLQPGHDLLWTHGPVWPWGQSSRSKVTNNGTRHHLEVVYLHAKYAKPVLNDK